MYLPEDQSLLVHRGFRQKKSTIDVTFGKQIADEVAGAVNAHALRSNRAVTW